MLALPILNSSPFHYFHERNCACFCVCGTRWAEKQRLLNFLCVCFCTDEGYNHSHVSAFDWGKNCLFQRLRQNNHETFWPHASWHSGKMCFWEEKEAPNGSPMSSSAHWGSEFFMHREQEPWELPHHLCLHEHSTKGADLCMKNADISEFFTHPERIFAHCLRKRAHQKVLVFSAWNRFTIFGEIICMYVYKSSLPLHEWFRIQC